MRIFLLAFLALPASAATFGTASTTPVPDFGVVKLVKGRVLNGTDILREGAPVRLNDVITTGPRSFARILLREGVALQVGPDSTVRLARDDAQPTTAEVVRGHLLTSVRKGESDEVKFRVRTRSASLGVRGTTFFTRDLDDGRTFLCVCEGSVSAKWDGGSETVTAKHHDVPKTFARGKARGEKAPMGDEHDDEQVKELKSLLL